METKDAVAQALEELAAQAAHSDRHDLVIFAATKAIVLSLMAVGEQLGRINDSLDSMIGGAGYDGDRPALRVLSYSADN